MVYLVFCNKYAIGQIYMWHERPNYIEQMFKPDVDFDWVLYSLGAHRRRVLNFILIQAFHIRLPTFSLLFLKIFNNEIRNNSICSSSYLLLIVLNLY